jgi:hypothetical protein
VPALCYQPTILPHLYPLNGALGTFTRGGSYSVVFQSCSAVFESYSVAFQSCSAVFESYSVKNLDRDTIGTDTRPMATRPLARAVANDWPAVREVRRRLQAYRAETISTDPLSLSGALICLLHLCSSCLHSPLTGPDTTSSPIRPLQASTLAPIHPTGTHSLPLPLSGPS